MQTPGPTPDLNLVTRSAGDSCALNIQKHQAMAPSSLSFPQCLSLILVSPLGKPDGRMFSLPPITQCYVLAWSYFLTFFFFPSRIKKVCSPPDRQSPVPGHSEQSNASDMDSWNMNAQVFGPNQKQGERSDLPSVYLLCPFSAHLFPSHPSFF